MIHEQYLLQKRNIGRYSGLRRLSSYFPWLSQGKSDLKSKAVSTAVLNSLNVWEGRWSPLASLRIASADTMQVTQHMQCLVTVHRGS